MDPVDAQAVFHIRAGLCSAYCGLRLIHFQCVQRPCSLQFDHGAVLHPDESERGILYLEGFRIPVAERISLIRLVGQLVEYRSCDRRHLIIVHHPERQVQRVGPDIDQRPAALLFFIQEYAPGRHRAPSQCVRFREIDLSQFSAAAHFFQISRVRAVTVLVCDIQHTSSLFRRIDHLLRFRIGDGHGLFAHNVFARFHGSDRDLCMAAVRCGYIYDVQVFLQEIPVILKYFCIFRTEAPF